MKKFQKVSKWQQIKTKHILCVIVREFIGLEHLQVVEDSHKSEVQTYIKKLGNYQYTPYVKILNHTTKEYEEKIVTLDNYTALTGYTINCADVKIVNSIKDVLQVKI